jgi:hypothetical protein
LTNIATKYFYILVFIVLSINIKRIIKTSLFVK